jgi:ribosomal protein S18 acetylase RimI-like enzyme
VPWQLTRDVEPYAERVIPLLSRDPALYTVALSVIDTLRAGHSFGEEPPLFGWLEEDGEIRGAVSHTPPFDLLLSVVPDPEPLVAALREAGAEVPGAHGQVDLVERFSAAWRAGTDLEATTWLQMRLFALGELDPPDPPPAGRARLATHGDLALALRWFDAFTEELNLPDRMSEERVRLAIDEERLWLWEDGEPGALALRTLAAAGVARIICVYTPPEQRGRRFGGAITAAACADALAREAERMVLFTDADNPAPNKVYERIGFRPVADYRVVHFNHDPADPPDLG